MSNSQEDAVGHDTATDEKYRTYASISFAVLLLGVGIPLWWYTTAVPRVPLPYSGIAALSHHETKIQTDIIVAALSKERAEQLAQEIKSFFEDSEIYSLRVRFEVVSRNLMSSAFTTNELETIAYSFNLKMGNLLLLEALNLNEEILVGSNRTVFFAPDTDVKKVTEIVSKWILRDKSLALTKNALTHPTEYSLDKENRRRFPTSPAYDVLLTLVNPDPEKLKVNWSLPTIADVYLQPFLNEISLVADFHIKSQWLYLVPLNVKPKEVYDSSILGRHFALSEDILPQLITPLEKKLASQVSLHPCINLVAYVVPCEEGPLHIYSRNGHRAQTVNIEAFHSPRWGGVVIINPPVDACISTKPVEITPNDATVIGVFFAQLRLLLGIPDPTPIPGAAVVPLFGFKPREWELDTLLRVRAVEQLTSAKLTLQSLAQLLEEISNIVITETVGNRIKNALNFVEESSALLQSGNLRDGFLKSKEAFATAEAAFTDPSLLALLYFPDDQKYAVYIPLFLPVMIPVLLSLKNIRQYYFPR
ncbi:GPI transamidase component PIG-S [Leptopilina boulardi]|uniref:GPI transamidase component PIG-S n=1 Tax=Leptopilina boulardi TaxID=63433 RepID=UPI0021F60F40|nr:GPI transamidase component PIG-S [Leptopilina boulardi]